MPDVRMIDLGGAPSEEMTCQELVELVTEYLEGTMAADERVLLELHLGECEDCVRYIEQIRQTIRLIGSVSSEDLSDETREGLVRAFREYRG